MSKQISDGSPVNVSGFVDPESEEQVERPGVIVSGGHTIDGEPHYDVLLDDAPFAGLIAATRVSRQ